MDRQFAENLPLNGRSFQTLIELTPGVVLTPSNLQMIRDNSVSMDNVQAPTIGWWTGKRQHWDRVANSSLQEMGLAGALVRSVFLGGTNSLVSVDAMQEFRIQTSTYAPEFGRTPRRADFHRYPLRHESISWRQHLTISGMTCSDANNWFNGYTNNPALPKAEERQNDFGGHSAGRFSRIGLSSSSPMRDFDCDCRRPLLRLSPTRVSRRHHKLPAESQLPGVAAVFECLSAAKPYQSGNSL